MSALPRFVVLYAALYAAFGVSSPFMPAFFAARGLTPEQVQMVRMAYGIDHEPLSQREIGRRLGLGRSTVRKRLAAALSAIRETLG